HPRSARSRDDDQGALRPERLLNRARDHFSDYRTHAAADKVVFHGADNHVTAIQLAAGVDHRVVQFGFFLRLFQALGIGLEIDKIQWIGGLEIVAEGFILAVIQQLCQSSACINAEVFAALWANIQVVFEVLLPDDLAAAFTLHPQSFGTNLLFARRIHLAGLSLEPSHKECFSHPYRSFLKPDATIPGRKSNT